MAGNSYRNAFQLIGAVAGLKMGANSAPRAQHAVQEKFNRAFSGKPLPPVNGYYEKILEIAKACRREGIPETITISYANAFLNQMQIGGTKDMSSGQVAAVFGASNSSEINHALVFGSGDAALFGLHMNVRKLPHIAELNDHVPFAYRFAHDKPPAAMLFIGACVPGSPSKTSMEHEAMLAYARAEKYAESVRRSNHYLGDFPASRYLGGEFGKMQINYYCHIRANKGDEPELAVVPIIPVVYDGRDRTVRVVFKAGEWYSSSVKLHELIMNSELGKNPWLARLAGSTKMHESNAAYPKVAPNSYIVKNIECVDARLQNSEYDSTGLIKEIGSAMSEEQKRRVARSLAEATNFNTHAMCGYNSTVLGAHMAFAELSRAFGEDSRIYLRKLVNSSMNRLLKGEITAYYGGDELAYSIHQLKQNRILVSSQTVEFLRAFMINTVNDTRETLKHSIERNVASVNGDAVYYMPCAARLEEIAREALLPGEMLSASHFDFLLAEEIARQLRDDFRQLIKKSDVAEEMHRQAGKGGHFSTATVTDLKTGKMMVPQCEIPSTREGIFSLEREYYYAPGQFARIGVDTETIMTR